MESALQDAVSRPAVAALVDELAMMPEEARKDRVRSFESSDPTDFDHIYASLLAVYYGSPQVAQKVRYVAESGPREVSPHFERSLIRKVAETDAGRRRL
ncbi:hypothetical protein [Mesorhizobium sp. WSM4887]|uniref:hypothetical protein n=1 Tax=Mesorhizobium sp. WSM4887 TaxID=3038543 RepID=UPI002415AF50|nr:hypothetical protein [Mesorhizobium sp. WSM4887]MDG4889778.1 hypothetical protein [Mesorhizobium sp. WSM4887]